MKYRLHRQEFNQTVMDFTRKKIRQNKIYVPRISNKNFREAMAVGRPIQTRGLPKHLVLKKLPGKLGYGIFLNPEAPPIPKGEAIAPYSGDVFVTPEHQGNRSDYAFSLIEGFKLTKEEQGLLDPKRPYHPRRLYSVDLDAEKKGNFTRFINHSTKKPNVEALFVRMPKVGSSPPSFEIIYVAKKRILPGEQLLTCYDGEGNSYWGPLKIKPFPMTPQTFRLNV